MVFTHGNAKGVGAGVNASTMRSNAGCPSDLGGGFSGGQVSVGPYVFQAATGEGAGGEEVIQEEVGVGFGVPLSVTKSDTDTDILLGNPDLCACLSGNGW